MLMHLASASIGAGLALLLAGLIARARKTRRDDVLSNVELAQDRWVRTIEAMRSAPLVRCICPGRVENRGVCSCAANGVRNPLVVRAR